MSLNNDALDWPDLHRFVPEGLVLIGVLGKPALRLKKSMIGTGSFGLFSDYTRALSDELYRTPLLKEQFRKRKERMAYAEHLAIRKIDAALETAGVVEVYGLEKDGFATRLGTPVELAERFNKCVENMTRLYKQHAFVANSLIGTTSGN